MARAFRILAAVIALIGFGWSSSQCFAALATDGISGSTNVSGAASIQPAVANGVTTANANDIIVVVINNDRTAGQGSLATVSAVTSNNGLTYTKRTSFSQSAFGSGQFIDLEVWYAVAASTVSDERPTVTFSTTVDNASMFAFGVSGANTSTPWDSNGSLPATASNSGTTTPTVTGITTSCDKTMAIVSSGFANPAGTTAYTAGTGFTLLVQTNTGAGSLFEGIGGEQQVFAATQSAISVAFGNTEQTWLAIADAIRDATASCGAAASRHSIPLTGAGN